MTWNAPSDLTTGTLVSASQWNALLGATGSLAYLKASPAFDGTVGIGVTPSGTYVVEATKNQNASTSMLVTNTTDGAAAYAGYSATGNNNTVSMLALPPSYSVAAYRSKGMIQSTAAAGLMLQNLNNGPIQFYVDASGATLAYYISGAGHLLTGTDNTVDIGASGATRPRNLYLAGSTVALGVEAAVSVAMGRRTTSNTAGQGLTVQAGSATSGATDKNGGDLVLSAGTATGSGGSNLYLAVALVGGAGTTDRTPANLWQVLGAGGSFGAVTDNTYDIGLNNNYRPRTLWLATSCVIGSPTGGDKGAGSINAVTVWRNGTSLDTVFGDGYALLPIAEMRAYYEEHRCLPTLRTADVHDAGSTDMGALTDRLWETVEVQARYIAELHDRVEALEARP